MCLYEGYCLSVRIFQILNGVLQNLVLEMYAGSCRTNLILIYNQSVLYFTSASGRNLSMFFKAAHSLLGQDVKYIYN
jgi:hypothetical protein